MLPWRARGKEARVGSSLASVRNNTPKGRWRSSTQDDAVPPWDDGGNCASAPREVRKIVDRDEG